MPTRAVKVRLTSSEKQSIAEYAKTSGMSISDFLRTTALSRIEDGLDLAAWDEAKREFDEDSQTLTAEEVAATYREK